MGGGRMGGVVLTVEDEDMGGEGGLERLSIHRDEDSDGDT